MDTVTITQERFRTLLEMAAESLAVESARRVQRAGRYFHPGDMMGTLICEAWNADPGLPAVVVAAYYSTFRRELHHNGMDVAPTADDVVASLRHSINEARYPDIDVPHMLARIRQDLPHYV